MLPSTDSLALSKGRRHELQSGAGGVMAMAAKTGADGKSDAHDEDVAAAGGAADAAGAAVVGADAADAAGATGATGAAAATGAAGAAAATERQIRQARALEVAQKGKADGKALGIDAVGMVPERTGPGAVVPLPAMGEAAKTDFDDSDAALRCFFSCKEELSVSRRTDAAALDEVLAGCCMVVGTHPQEV